MAIRFIRKSFVQQKLRGNGFKVKPEVYGVIDDFLSRALDRLIESVGSDNIKTLGTDEVLSYLKIPKAQSPVAKQAKVETSSENNWCDRCIILHDWMIPLARSIQSNIVSLAKKVEPE